MIFWGEALGIQYILNDILPITKICLTIQLQNTIIEYVSLLVRGVAKFGIAHGSGP